MKQLTFALSIVVIMLLSIPTKSNAAVQIIDDNIYTCVDDSAKVSKTSSSTTVNSDKKGACKPKHISECTPEEKAKCAPSRHSCSDKGTKSKACCKPKGSKAK